MPAVSVHVRRLQIPGRGRSVNVWGGLTLNDCSATSMPVSRSIMSNVKLLKFLLHTPRKIRASVCAPSQHPCPCFRTA